ncbi:hypothetical protein [Streptomyces sp. NBC_00198]|uniref:hypothetical protein n=1 Tax=Streptomyces sp. NBC_00198 TaxID=2975677 RepID=UPI00225AF059|nr:hypothetical protein [Streptomyces sp. NBC_00198]MCX5285946.1 hypothetical protein [Streptomyces sp. NBC_00198]MCX5286255.1 hypothetical protein [Streptomyces sp. NBC_00198]
MGAGTTGGASWRKWAKRIVPPVIAAVVGAGFTAVINPAGDHTAVAAATPEATGKITSLDGTPVGRSVVLKGSVQHAPKGYVLWAWVEDSSGHFFPTYSPCIIEKDGVNWHCPEVRPAAPGTKSGSTKTLHVAFVTANGALDIDQYRQDREANVKVKPFKDMTAGAIEIDSQDVAIK